MKKNLLTAVTLVGIVMLTKAQEGNVGINTSSPKATLDIVGKPADATRLDGLIAPRLTGDQLSSKTYTAEQTGALVYATAAATSLTGQVVNVSASGYYYFNGTVWQAVSSGSGTSTNIYNSDGILTGNRIVTQNNNNLTFTTGTGRLVVNGTQQNTGAQYIKYRKVTAAPITWANNDYALILEFGSNFSSGGLSLPDATTNEGRMIYIGNSSGNSATFSATNTATTPRVGSTITTGTGFTYVSDGTTWYIISGR